MSRTGTPRGTGVADDWWWASNVGPNWPGTLVPESFDLSVAGQKFSVHPNATKHMAVNRPAGVNTTKNLTNAKSSLDDLLPVQPSGALRSVGWALREGHAREPDRATCDD